MDATPRSSGCTPRRRPLGWGRVDRGDRSATAVELWTCWSTTRDGVPSVAVSFAVWRRPETGKPYKDRVFDMLQSEALFNGIPTADRSTLKQQYYTGCLCCSGNSGRGVKKEKIQQGPTLSPRKYFITSNQKEECVQCVLSATAKHHRPKRESPSSWKCFTESSLWFKFSLFEQVSNKN